MGHPRPPSPRSGGCSAISYTGVPARGSEYRLGDETAVQDADGPVLLQIIGAVTCGRGDAVGVLAVASVLSAEPEILRCISEAPMDEVKPF